MNREPIFNFLCKADDEFLAEVYSSFFINNWPENLPAELKPEWWDGNNVFYGQNLNLKRYMYSQPIKEYILEKIDKNTLRKMLFKP